MQPFEQKWRKKEKVREKTHYLLMLIAATAMNRMVADHCAVFIEFIMAAVHEQIAQFVAGSCHACFGGSVSKSSLFGILFNTFPFKFDLAQGLAILLRKVFHEKNHVADGLGHRLIRFGFCINCFRHFLNRYRIIFPVMIVNNVSGNLENPRLHFWLRRAGYRFSNVSG